ncbi:MAG: hypothetical protein WAK17_27755 [Candidatus Nitrosopolaris sp.]
MFPLKDIVRRALDAEDNYNLLFIGPPASVKTLFLSGILESKRECTLMGATRQTELVKFIASEMQKEGLDLNNEEDLDSYLNTKIM